MFLTSYKVEGTGTSSEFILFYNFPRWQEFSATKVVGIVPLFWPNNNKNAVVMASCSLGHYKTDDEKCLPLKLEKPVLQV